MITKSWKIYGFTGHRQRLSFEPSFTFDFSQSDYPRNVILSCDCADITGTNDYVILRITAESAEECLHEFNGQLSDGFFENVHVGRIEELPAKITD